MNKEEMIDKFENTVKMYAYNDFKTIPDFEIEYARNYLKIDINDIDHIINKYKLKIKKTNYL